MSRSAVLREKDAKAVRDFVERVRACLGSNLIELRLFGSKVTGQDEPDSDIDIAVAVQHTSSSVENQVIDVAFDVNLAHDVYISPRVIPQTVFDHPVWRITPFIKEIESHGVRL